MAKSSRRDMDREVHRKVSALLEVLNISEQDLRSRIVRVQAVEGMRFEVDGERIKRTRQEIERLQKACELVKGMQIAEDGIRQEIQIRERFLKSVRGFQAAEKETGGEKLKKSPRANAQHAAAVVYDLLDARLPGPVSGRNARGINYWGACILCWLGYPVGAPAHAYDEKPLGLFKRWARARRRQRRYLSLDEASWRKGRSSGELKQAVDNGTLNGKTVEGGECIVVPDEAFRDWMRETKEKVNII